MMRLMRLVTATAVTLTSLPALAVKVQCSDNATTFVYGPDDFQVLSGVVRGGVSAGGGGVHPHGLSRQRVDPHQARVEILLKRRPDGGLVQGIEDVGQAIVVEVLGPHRLAQASRQHLQAIGGPILELVEPMVTGGDDVGQPDGNDFTLGQFAGPVAVGGKVLVQQTDDPHALELGQ